MRSSMGGGKERFVMLKNRMGSFYPPSSVLIDTGWIRTQDRRNVSNGCGEIIKLAMVKSSDLFDLLYTHGPSLISSSFLNPPSESNIIIKQSIEIMLVELGPNLWEKNLDRSVDYGHTFSKVLEMLPDNTFMHGEAVNIDGYLCLVLSYLRGRLSLISLEKCRTCMVGLRLPLTTPLLTSAVCLTAISDAIEHRNGLMRVPLVEEIGSCYFVNDITEGEIERALEWIREREG